MSSNLTEIQDEIAASFSLFKKTPKFKSNIQYKPLIKYFSKLKTSAAAVNKNYKAFSTSSKRIGDDAESKVWSFDKIVDLLVALDKLEVVIEDWLYSSELQYIANNTPLDPTPWTIQADIARFIANTKKQVKKIKNYLEPFVNFEQNVFVQGLLDQEIPVTLTPNSLVQRAEPQAAEEEEKEKEIEKDDNDEDEEF